MKDLRKNLRKAYKFYIYYNTMVTKKKSLLLLAGVFSTVAGIMFMIPSFLKASYYIAAFSTVLVVAGLILIAIAFGD